jgi:hypothetical protein
MVNHSTRVIRRSPRARPSAARAAAAIAAVVVLALLAAACGGRSPSPAGSGSPSSVSGQANTPSAVAYSSCMRAHGVPNFPDPTSSGAIPKGSAQEFGVSSSQYHTAQTACAGLVPVSVGSMQQCEEDGVCPPALVQQALNLMRRYARCMRAHGVPNWPDPSIGPEGQPLFNVSAVGITYQFTHSSSFAAKDSECERLVGGSAGVPVPLG